MNRKLKYYGGDGYGFRDKEIGEYKVSTEANDKEFTKLSEARKYYNSLNEEKLIWNTKTMELLEAHTF